MLKIIPSIVRRTFPKRDPETQKWSYGHCLVIAGSKNLLGAAVLTTRAALKGGAGLVTLALPESLQKLVYLKLAPALTLPLKETRDGTVDFGALGKVLAYIKDRKITSVVLGPGLTYQKDTKQFVHALVSRVGIPLVLDADAINAKPKIKKQNVFCCLTPHYKEFARFLGVDPQDVVANGDVHARKLTRAHSGLVVVLKGPNTKIVAKDGTWVNRTGNAGMAKGGSGDVLAGLLGSFLAQKRDYPSYLHSVLSAVYLHGLAGDLAVRDLSEVAVNAEDILNYLPKAFKKIGIR